MSLKLKSIRLVYTVLSALFFTSLTAQTLIGDDAAKVVKGSEKIILKKFTQIPDFIQFRADAKITYTGFETWAKTNLKLPAGSGFKVLNADKDKLGMVHYRLQQTVHHVPVEGTMYIVHTKDGQIQSMNGQLMSTLTAAAKATLSEKTALDAALKFTNAESYKWQSPKEEEKLKLTTRNPKATYYPKGILTYTAKNGDLATNEFRLAYRFDIYADKPMSRKYVFVDAQTGKVIHTEDRIFHIDVPATAHTQYTGIKTIMTDSTGTNSFRLQETGRGGGIQTYDEQTGTTPTNIDFTNTSTNWNNVNANLDQYATDAHLASEATYDYYFNTYGRNSIDGAGFALISNVHNSVNLENAYWDGAQMNYGDGNVTNGTRPFTAPEIGGHEITHGLTQFTAQLPGRMEGGALNEAFSDCAGITIRHQITQSTNVDYLVGNLNGTAFRSFANPKNYQLPNTYGGTYWVSQAGCIPNGANDNCGVHTNMGVMMYWYYLLAHGGRGTNDSAHAYNIPAIGLTKAAAITFRNQTVYMTSGSVYADARTYSIQAANDLFGTCSPEVIAVTNAWFAVGIGDSFSTVVTANFTPSITTSCSVPATINFNNTSTGGSSYTWSFGDHQGSGATSPTHVFNSFGTYNVNLVARGCGTDSSVIAIPITLNDNPPLATPTAICSGQTSLLNATGNGTLKWYTAGTGGSSISTGSTFTTPTLTHTTTYYVESDVISAPATCGPTDNAIGRGSNFNNNTPRGLIFDCTSPRILVSVDVYAQATGSRTIVLQDSVGGNTMQSITVTVPNTGLNTITLNFPLPVANHLFLTINGTPNLYRNQAGAAFPYNASDNSISITGTNGNTGYYYFFYNWILQGNSCISSRTAVPVTVLNAVGGTFNYTSNGTTVTFIPSAPGLSSYHWDFGDGGTSPASNPNHTFSSLGNHTVQLIESNGSCTDTINLPVNVGTSTGIKEVTELENITVYPNPASNSLNVQVNAEQDLSGYKLILQNVLGETLQTQDARLNGGKNILIADVSALASGVYLVSLQNEKAAITKRFVIQH